MGNMLTDSRKGLGFSYNLANLPESVEGADGASLTHIYLLFGINRQYYCDIADLYLYLRWI